VKVKNIMESFVIENTKLTVQREFEDGGADVVIFISLEMVNREKVDTRDGVINLRPIRVEIKPVVGDDYPAVLRQMKRNGSKYLLVREYNGVGATRQQFVDTFKTADIKVVFLDEVNAAIEWNGEDGCLNR
jgi:hypothetical protein